MAHHTNQKRLLAAAPQLKPSADSMDPTLKKQPTRTIIPTKSPDPTIPSKRVFLADHFSRLNFNPKIRTSGKPTNQQYNPPPSKDIHLQAKAMTVSADSDSSKFLLVKASYQPQKTSVPKVEKVGRTTKEKSKKDLDKKQLQQEQLNGKLKQLFEEVKDEEVKDLEEKRISVSLGRRRSFCGTHVELADILANCGVKVVSVDMPPFMQIHAVDFARKTRDSLEKFTSKALALTLKKEFDGVYGPAWHCIVGTSFGSFVTHSIGGFLYFSMDRKLYILLFKTTVQRAT